jgi:hypothetical protein
MEAFEIKGMQNLAVESMEKTNGGVWIAVGWVARGVYTLATSTAVRTAVTEAATWTGYGALGYTAYDAYK